MSSTMLFKISQILLVIFAVYSGQNDHAGLVVDPRITVADRNAIIKLAKQFGIEYPQTVSLGSCVPGSCRFVSVESQITQVGYRRTWSQLLLCNRKWRKQCPGVSRRAIVKRQGQWETSSDNLSVREEWRIEDHGWHVDLRPGTGCSYEDVRLIVLAIRRGELINRLPLNDTMPQVDPNDIASIEKPNDEPRIYKVIIGRLSGMTLTVRIVDGKVEVRSHGIWIV
jgi:hypothetical protein